MPQTCRQSLFRPPRDPDVRREVEVFDDPYVRRSCVNRAQESALVGNIVTLTIAADEQGNLSYAAGPC